MGKEKIIMPNNKDKYPVLYRAIQEANPEELDLGEENEEEIPFDEEENAPVSEPVLVKFKPVYNFQSAEFEMLVDFDNPDSVDKAFAAYKQCLNKLKDLAPDQPKLVDIPKVELATDKQKENMDKFGITYTDKTTKEQARKLITENMKKAGII